jgi:hypothetical protein
MASIDEKIYVNSPFKVVHTSTDLTKAILRIWIYSGVQGDAQAAGTDAPPSNGRTEDSLAYTLTSTAVGLTDEEYVAFEISSLIRGFIKEKYDGSSSDSSIGQTIFVDYQLTTFLGSNATIQALKRCVAYDGYTYFEEGFNAQIACNGLLSADVISKLEDTPIEIGVDINETARVSFLNKGDLINSKAVSTNNTGSTQLEYVSGTYDNSDRYELRVLNDAGIFEDSTCLRQFKCTEELFECDTIYVEDRAGDIRVIKVNTLERTQHTPYKVTFINKDGAFEHIWFAGNSTESLNVKSKNFNRVTTDYTSGGSYSISDAPRYRQRLSSNKEITLNSGFHPEGSNSSFEQMLQSNDVWIEYDNVILPLLIKSSTFNIKTHLNDDAINYTVRAEFAFNRINNL